MTSVTGGRTAAKKVSFPTASPKDAPPKQVSAQSSRPDTAAKPPAAPAASTGADAFRDAARKLTASTGAAAQTAPPPAASGASAPAPASAATAAASSPAPASAAPPPPSPSGSSSGASQLVTVSSATPTGTRPSTAAVSTTSEPATGALQAGLGAAAAGFVSSSLAYGLVGNSVEVLAKAGLQRAGVPETAATYVGTLVGGAAAGVSLRVAAMAAQEVGSFVGRNQFTESQPADMDRKLADFVPPLSKVAPDVIGFGTAFAMFNGADAKSAKILTTGGEFGKLAFKAARSGTGGAFSAVLRDGLQALRTLPAGSEVKASRMPPREDHAWENLGKEIRALVANPSLTKPKDSPSRGTAANAVATAAGYLAFTAVAARMDADFAKRFAATAPTPAAVAPATSAPATASPTTPAPTTAAPSPSPSSPPSAAPSPSPTSPPSAAPSAQPSAATAAPSAARAASSPDSAGTRALSSAASYADHGGYNAASIVGGVVAFVVVEHIVGAFLNELSDRAQDARRERLGLPETYAEERRTLPISAPASGGAASGSAGASGAAPAASPFAAASSVQSAPPVSGAFPPASAAAPLPPAGDLPPLPDTPPSSPVPRPKAAASSYPPVSDAAPGSALRNLPPLPDTPPPSPVPSGSGSPDKNSPPTGERMEI